MLYLGMIVFLIGFMGSGKTTIGKSLAKQLNYGFVDMDTAIELETGQKISELFSKFGEAYFRQLEKDWLLQFKGENVIVSVGGGTPCFNDNLAVMKQKGTSIFLSVPIKMMAQRVQQAKNTRPLIEPYVNDFDSLVAFMNKLLTERMPFYNEADIIFEASNMSANKKELLADMVKRVGQRKL